jgi:methylenetetrahydrofolate reductase (NADPH)
MTVGAVPSIRDPGIKFSVEIYPPAKLEARVKLTEQLGELDGLGIYYVSVTFGAGGTTRDRTIEMVRRVIGETSFDVAAHLTCVGASCAEVNQLIEQYEHLGVRRIVALRGDPPGGFDVPYYPHPEGYQTTADLVAVISKCGLFDISVAAYPEKHPQSPNVKADFDTLKSKVDAGADCALTQFFFDNDRFYEFFDRALSYGISVPIVPGILPIMNFAQVKTFAGKCGASIPSWIVERYDGLDDDPQESLKIGLDIAIQQIVDLAAQGHREFHIYCLNRPEIVRSLISSIGFGNKSLAEV